MNTELRRYKILVVDDEPLIRESLYESLRISGFEAFMAASADEAMEILKDSPMDIMITDLKLPAVSGMDLLKQVKSRYSDIEVIMMTGYGSIDSAVEAMKNGAYDYITKPVNDNEIQAILQKIIEKKNILQENRALKEMIARSQREIFQDIIGSSDKMQKVYHVIESVASSRATILITGESGTGKGMAARAIHQCDENRKDKPFIEISCGALSETLLESELFGHVKGAFTGAIKDKEGRFEYARGGTVFLDEIDAFTPALQVKLLRFLQDGVFERVGDNVTRKADVRIVVATNRNLLECVKKGDFREDLYYRINVINVHLPPLRERKEDLPLLVEHFLEKYASINGKKITGLAPDVQRLFAEYHWPGNIRELENAVEGAIIMARSETINRWDLPNPERFSTAYFASVRPQGKTLKEVIQNPEREAILAALRTHNWNRNRASAALGINRTTLYNKMKKYNIEFKKPRS